MSRVLQLDPKLGDKADPRHRQLWTDAAIVTRDLQAQILTKSPIASPTFTGTVTTAAIAMGNNVLSGVKSVSYNGLYAGYGTSGSITVAFSNGACQRVDPTGNITLSFTFPGIGWYTLHISEGDDLDERITWPAASSTVFYVNRASAPAAMDANKHRLVTIYYNGTQMFIRIDSLNSATD
jgi:hypothetical protein